VTFRFQMEVIAAQACSCWSDRALWTGKPSLGQWFRDWRRIRGG